MTTYNTLKRMPPSSFAFLTIYTITFLWIITALASYAETDPSIFFYQTEPNTLHNFGGTFGAYTASTLLYFFGSAAFGILFVLAFIIWNVLHQHRFLSELDRYIACICALFICSALCALHTMGHTIYGFAGGRTGFLTVHFLANWFDAVSIGFLLWSSMIGAIVVIAHNQLFSLIHATMRVYQYAYKHRELAYTAGRHVWHATVVCSRPFVLSAQYFYALCNGKRIKQWTQEVMQDEYDSTTQSDEQFFATYFSNQAEECEQEPDTKHSTGAWHESTNNLPTQKDFCQDDLYAMKDNSAKNYTLPPLESYKRKKAKQIDKETAQEHEHKAKLLEEKLAHFGIKGSVVSIKRGPVVTLYEYQPHIDARISKITALDDDLALALQALSIRIIAPIPGTAFIGFEVANNVRDTVYWSDIMQSEKAQKSTCALPLAIGCDTSGSFVISDLAKMPHLLVAGSTGSGKSVALQTMIMSLLCHCTPESLRLILIDPKRLEFAAYTDIAHLLFPVITHAKHAIGALKWAVKEMEERYEEMKRIGARSITDYHAYAKKYPDSQSMPYLVIIIDEFADLMMMGGKEIEELITRITQMARAAGIHMIIATQRPSVDVITGIIKVNFPSRIACRVASKIDSRTILDCNGAEKLLGRGDMLMIDATDPGIKRVHGAFASDEEIIKIIQHIREQRTPDYIEFDAIVNNTSIEINGTDDALYQEIISFINDLDEVSISLLQRKFRIGYNRSARIIEALEAQGVVASSDGGKMRKVIRQ